MDPITAIIVTVLANAVVTGVIVYFIQKRVESTFAKKLEEFKAKLQYSSFEEQTKFVQLHTQRVETLQTLYKKFVLFTVTLGDWVRLMAVDGRDKLKIEDGEYEKLSEAASELLEDFMRFFQANRLILTTKLIVEITDIYLKASDTRLLVYFVAFWDEKTALPWELMADIREDFTEGIEREHPRKFHDQIYRQIAKLTVRFEQTYRAVAEAKPLE